MAENILETNEEEVVNSLPEVSVGDTQSSGSDHEPIENFRETPLIRTDMGISERPHIPEMENLINRARREVKPRTTGSQELDRRYSNAVDPSEYGISGDNRVRTTITDVDPNDYYATLSSGKQVSRYKEYIPGIDNRERLAQMQTRGEKWGNSLKKFGIGVGAAIGGGTVGLVSSTLGAITGANSDILHDNAFSDWAYELNEKMEYTLPVYTTQEYEDKSLFQQMGHANFWANDVLGGSTFTVGMLASEAIWAAATRGTSLLTLGARAAARTARAAGMVSRSSRNIGRGVAKNTVQKSKEAAKKLINDKVAKDAAARAQGGVVWANRAKGALNTGRQIYTSAFYEAQMEAKFFIEETREDYVSEFEYRNGRKPNATEMREFERDLMDSANYVTAANIALVGGTNLMTFGRFLTGARHASKYKNNMLRRSLFGEGFDKAKDGSVKALKPNNFQKVAGRVYGFAKPVVSEGFIEEAGQNVIGTTANEFIMAAHDPGQIRESIDLVDAFYRGMEEAYGTKEGQKEILVGGIVGLLFGGAQSRFRFNEVSQNIKEITEAAKVASTVTYENLMNETIYSAQARKSAEMAKEAARKGDMVGVEMANGFAEVAKMQRDHMFGGVLQGVKDYKAYLQTQMAQIQEDLGVDAATAEQIIEDAVNTYSEKASEYAKNREYAEALFGDRDIVEFNNSNIQRETIIAATAAYLTINRDADIRATETINQIKQRIQKVLGTTEQIRSMDTMEALRRIDRNAYQRYRRASKKLEALEKKKENIENRLARLNSTRELNEKEASEREKLLQEYNKTSEKVEKELAEKNTAYNALGLEGITERTVTQEDLDKQDERLKALTDNLENLRKTNPVLAQEIETLINEYQRSVEHAKTYSEMVEMFTDPNLRLTKVNNWATKMFKGKRKLEDSYAEFFLNLQRDFYSDGLGSQAQTERRSATQVRDEGEEAVPTEKMEESTPEADIDAIKALAKKIFEGGTPAEGVETELFERFPAEIDAEITALNNETKSKADIQKELEEKQARLEELRKRQQERANQDRETAKTQLQEEIDEIQDRIESLIEEGREEEAKELEKEKKKLAGELEALGQNEGPKIKGAFQRTPKSVITLLDKNNADVTTPIHELAHEFEDSLSEEELKAIEEWSGHRRGTTEFSEAFAVGAERYIYEGPSGEVEVDSIFKRLAKWFQQVIEDAATYFGSINELNEDMQLIYDKMFLDGLVGGKNINGSLEAEIRRLDNLDGDQSTAIATVVTSVRDKIAEKMGLTREEYDEISAYNTVKSLGKTIENDKDKPLEDILFQSEGVREEVKAQREREAEFRNRKRWNPKRGRQALEGVPNVKTRKNVRGADPELTYWAHEYARRNGINLNRQSEYVEVDEEFATRVAQAFEEMKHEPENPEVKEAYRSLIEQTKAQYEILREAGYEFYFYNETNDPYAGSPWAAMEDLRNNKRMAVFETEGGFGNELTEQDFGDNPMLEDTGITWEFEGEPKRVLANDLFRAVHDAFGHGLEGAGFRARGEENAWQAHARMFVGPAIGAITTETRGQNSWLNYGKYGEQNRNAKVEDTIFADQKIGLMPSWTWTENFDEGVSGDRALPEFGTEGFQNLSPEEKANSIGHKIDPQGSKIADLNGFKFSRRDRVPIFDVVDRETLTEPEIRVIEASGVTSVRMYGGRSATGIASYNHVEKEMSIDVNNELGSAIFTSQQEVNKAIVHESIHAIIHNSGNAAAVNEELGPIRDKIVESKEIAGEYLKRVIGFIENGSNEEVLTYMLTVPELAEFMSTLPSTKSTTYESSSLWSQLLDAIRRALTGNSLLGDAMHILDKYTSEEVESEDSQPNREVLFQTEVQGEQNLDTNTSEIEATAKALEGVASDKFSLGEWEQTPTARDVDYGGITWQQSGISSFNQGTDGKTYITDKDDSIYQISKTKLSANNTFIVTVKDTKGNEVASFEFKKNKDGSFSSVEAFTSKKGKGIASIAYDFASKDGEVIKPSKILKQDGVKFWSKSISKAYHKAKAGGSNLELIKAVEELIGKPEIRDVIDYERTLPQSVQELEQIKAQAIADGTFMKAPNGNSTNLNERQWLQVRTEAFKNWFGDWINDPKNSSKVIDSNGEPMVVYHGSPSKGITVFDRNKNKYSDNIYNIKGNWFAGESSDINYERGADKFIAKQFAGQEGEVYSAFLNIRRPMEFEFYDDLLDIIEKVGGVDNFYKRIKNRDGIILTDSMTDGDVLRTDFNVFHPNQIKSATDNIGDFSTQSADIRYQTVGQEGPTQQEIDSEDVKLQEDINQLQAEIEELGKELETEQPSEGFINSHIQIIKNKIRELIGSNEYTKEYLGEEASELIKRKPSKKDVDKFTELMGRISKEGMKTLELTRSRLEDVDVPATLAEEGFTQAEIEEFVDLNKKLGNWNVLDGVSEYGTSVADLLSILKQYESAIAPEAFKKAMVQKDYHSVKSAEDKEMRNFDSASPLQSPDTVKAKNTKQGTEISHMEVTTLATAVRADSIVELKKNGDEVEVNPKTMKEEGRTFLIRKGDQEMKVSIGRYARLVVDKTKVREMVQDSDLKLVDYGSTTNFDIYERVGETEGFVPMKGDFSYGKEKINYGEVDSLKEGQRLNLKVDTNDPYNKKLIKEYNRKSKKASEAEKEDLRADFINRLHIYLTTENGELLGSMRALYDEFNPNSQETASLRLIRENAASYILEDNLSGEIDVEMTVPVNKVLMGSPNFIVREAGDGSLVPDTMEITPQALKTIKAAGVWSNGKLQLNRKGLETKSNTMFLRGMEGNVPVVVFEYQGKNVAFPVSLVGTVTDQRQLVLDIFELDLREVEKIQLVNRLMAEKGINPADNVLDPTAPLGEGANRQVIDRILEQFAEVEDFSDPNVWKDENFSLSLLQDQARISIDLTNRPLGTSKAVMKLQEFDTYSPEKIKSTVFGGQTEVEKLRDLDKAFRELDSYADRNGMYLADTLNNFMETLLDEATLISGEVDSWIKGRQRLKSIKKVLNTKNTGRNQEFNRMVEELRKDVASYERDVDRNKRFNKVTSKKLKDQMKNNTVKNCK